jgi:aminoglycoside phosphotransferase family enzyme
MTREQIDELAAHGAYPEDQVVEKVIETHISFVLLCTDRVYKIKKPVTMSFLDFSSIEKRKYFVEQELILNQRLCPEIYLRTLDVSFHEGRYRIGGKEGEVIDHALEMMRLDNEREMDILLEKGLVGTEDIDRVLDVLIPFHQEALLIHGHVAADDLFSDFADVAQITDYCAFALGEPQAALLSESISFVKGYLTAQEELLATRDAEGFVRDVHGDLHAGNIFLTERPVLFDCIEFNPHFRQIDLLNELAYFTMELDFAGYPELGEHLIREYNGRFPVMRNPKEERLFLFYKLYRANVKMKVTAIRAEQSTDASERSEQRKHFELYFKLYQQYLEKLKNAD